MRARAAQRGNGFVARGLIENYVQDEPTNGWAVLLEWPNTDYRKFDLPQPYAEFFKHARTVRQVL